MKDINVEDIADLTDATDNVRVFCPVHDVYYECAGVPTQVSALLILLVLVLQKIPSEGSSSRRRPLLGPSPG